MQIQTTQLQIRTTQLQIRTIQKGFETFECKFKPFKCKFEPFECKFELFEWKFEPFDCKFELFISSQKVRQKLNEMFSKGPENITEKDISDFESQSGARVGAKILSLSDKSKYAIHPGNF